MWGCLEGGRGYSKGLRLRGGDGSIPGRGVPDEFRQALPNPIAAAPWNIPYRKEDTPTKRTPDAIPRPRTQAKRIASCGTNDIERPQGSSYGNPKHTLTRQAQEGGRLRALPLDRPAAVTSRRSQEPQTARRTKEK